MAKRSYWYEKANSIAYNEPKRTKTIAFRAGEVETKQLEYLMVKLGAPEYPLSQTDAVLACIRKTYLAECEKEAAIAQDPAQCDTSSPEKM